MLGAVGRIASLGGASVIALDIAFISISFQDSVIIASGSEAHIRQMADCVSISKGVSLCVFAEVRGEKRYSYTSSSFSERRSITALTATMMDEADIKSAETSGRSDQPKEL